MTAKNLSPMPPVDPAALHCAPVEVEPILETLAWQIASDLWPDVDAIDTIKARSGEVDVHARLNGVELTVSLHWGDGDRMLADLWGETHSGIDTINAPDRSIAGLMLARLRGGR